MKALRGIRRFPCQEYACSGLQTQHLVCLAWCVVGYKARNVVTFAREPKVPLARPQRRNPPSVVLHFSALFCSHQLCVAIFGTPQELIGCSSQLINVVCGVIQTFRALWDKFLTSMECTACSMLNGQCTATGKARSRAQFPPQKTHGSNFLE